MTPSRWPCAATSWWPPSLRSPAPWWRHHVPQLHADGHRAPGRAARPAAASATRRSRADPDGRHTGAPAGAVGPAGRRRGDARPGTGRHRPGTGVTPEEYEELSPLAAVLGAELAATRKVTDRGWAPRSARSASRVAPSPRGSTSRSASAGSSTTWSGCGRRGPSWPSTRTARRRSSSTATWALWVTGTRSCPNSGMHCAGPRPRRDSATIS